MKLYDAVSTLPSSDCCCSDEVRLAAWPDGVKRYVASMYEMEPDVWERVAEFIDAGSRSE